MSKKFVFLSILLIGLLFRFYLTSNGDFIFHMDNARDMIDIREITLLGKHRLIGPISGIEGFYNGSGWYYLLAAPFVISSGDPHVLVIFQSVLWAVGGFFLLLLVSRWGIWATVSTGAIWIASNLLILSSQNSLSPNGVIFLMPLFVYLLEKFLQTNRLIFNLLVWFLAGMFFQLEMATAVFLPVVILLSRWLVNKKGLVSKQFWLGVGVFVLTLLPQLVFELRHNFVMTEALWRYLTSSNNHGLSFNFVERLTQLVSLYQTVVSALMMNYSALVWLVIVSLGWAIKVTLGSLQENKLLLVSGLIFVLPLLGYLLLPFRAMSWHVAGTVTVLLLTLGWLTAQVQQKIGQPVTIALAGIIIILSLFNVYKYHLEKVNNLRANDPSLFKNELAAIDYVYVQAQGKNFKVYVYLPSVIDYPYQYLIYWYGLKRYGYLPQDYAYLPHQPVYIQNKQLLPTKYAKEDSELIFLIKEPDLGNRRHLWENSFSDLPVIKKDQVGPIEIEVRQEVS